MVSLVWLQAAGCTGCSVSLLNTDYPHIKNLLLDEVVPGKALGLLFHGTLMGATGQLALKALERIPLEKAKGYVLVVEGAVPKEDFGEVGGTPIAKKVEELAANALAVLAMGTCASYGGIPAAQPNPTQAQDVKTFLQEKGFKVPVVNVRDAHPTRAGLWRPWFTLFSTGFQTPKSSTRPEDCARCTPPSFMRPAPEERISRWGGSPKRSERKAVYMSWAAKARTLTRPVRTTPGTAGSTGALRLATLVLAAVSQNFPISQPRFSKKLGPKRPPLRIGGGYAHADHRSHHQD